jgi:hypothetical protein
MFETLPPSAAPSIRAAKCCYGCFCLITFASVCMSVLRLSQGLSARFVFEAGIYLVMFVLSAVFLREAIKFPASSQDKFRFRTVLLNHLLLPPVVIN